MKPNTKFNLDVTDIDLIETALRNSLNSVNDSNAKEINDLLAKIHHQKIWYRPKRNTYISG